METKRAKQCLTASHCKHSHVPLAEYETWTCERHWDGAPKVLDCAAIKAVLLCTVSTRRNIITRKCSYTKAGLFSWIHVGSMITTRMISIGISETIQIGINIFADTAPLTESIVLSFWAGWDVGLNTRMVYDFFYLVYILLHMPVYLRHGL